MHDFRLPATVQKGTLIWTGGARKKAGFWAMSGIMGAGLMKPDGDCPKMDDIAHGTDVNNQILQLKMKKESSDSLGEIDELVNYTLRFDLQ